MNNYSTRTSTASLSKNKKTSKKKGFIPAFYECDLNVLGKENFKIVHTSNGINLYITPLIRTLISDIKNYDLLGHESLGRYIKEKMCSNSRLLIKKSSLQSKIIFIKDKQYVLVNADIHMIKPNLFRIMNTGIKETNMI